MQEDEMNQEEETQIIASIKKPTGKGSIKTLYVKFPFDTWLQVAKRALEQQKQRGVVVVDILNEYFGLDRM